MIGCELSLDRKPDLGQGSSSVQKRKGEEKVGEEGMEEEGRKEKGISL